MSASDIKAKLERYGLTPNRALGQNFLADGAAAAKIAEAACAEGLPVIEIGPGLGALTAGLMERAPRVAAVEIDGRMADILEKELPDLELLRGDVLKTDLDAVAARLGGRVSVAANLPYYVTGPVCFKLIRLKAAASLTLTVQKEAEARFFAGPGDRVYGPLSVLARYYFSTHELMPLPPTAFYPVPEVDSAAVRLVRRDVPPRPLLEWVCRTAFAMRRKTLANNLRAAGISDERLKTVLGRCGLDGNVRAERLTPSQFADISEEIEARGK